MRYFFADGIFSIMPAHTHDKVYDTCSQLRHLAFLSLTTCHMTYLTVVLRHACVYASDSVCFFTGVLTHGDTVFVHLFTQSMCATEGRCKAEVTTMC